MFCFHRFGEITDGYQFCSKCHKAILVPCNHHWVEKEYYDIRNRLVGVIVGIVHIRECSKCGELKQFKTDVYD